MSSNLGMMSTKEHNGKMTSEGLSAKITNSTPENIIVYGPKRALDSGNYDKSWYILHPGETTPSRWEFEGLFVPKDRKFGQENAEAIQGPVAVRYPVSKSVTITKDGDQYLENGQHNDGIFHASEINWPVPDFDADHCQKMSKHAFQIRD
ncbi:hypothetical protein [Clostridium sp. DJ247]|uniref:hypothetical protein n=1 Tax=Clostridium sp. DJ247 TaxID=2726188 RepID=UPI001623BD25|nr:hypothetical protein [Clostridium sp. DJ247]MBC2581990.1 hypothetical protein [Clostridium sp. DJ247]